MESTFLTRKIQKSLSVLYGLIGMLIAIEIWLELWDQGAFGNEVYGSGVLGPWEPMVGYLLLLSALTLSAGQVFVFFKKRLGVQLSRVSFILAIMTDVSHYLVFKAGYIWGYFIDFSVMLFIIILFYLPVIINPGYYGNKAHLKLNS